MSKGITALLSRFKEAQRELRRRLEDEGEELLKESFKELFDKHQGLKVFAYIGYTPRFNDGEPCEHSDDSYIGSEYFYRQTNWGTYWSNDWDDREYLTEVFVENYEDFDESEPPSEDNNPLLVNRNCTTLTQAASDVQDFEDAIEMVYGTNYQIIVRLEDDGSVSIDHDEYDRGY